MLDLLPGCLTPAMSKVLTGVTGAYKILQLGGCRYDLDARHDIMSYVYQ